jgi:hypothetical protein
MLAFSFAMPALARYSGITIPSKGTSVNAVASTKTAVQPDEGDLACAHLAAGWYRLLKRG